VRGALQPLPGVRSVDVVPGRKLVTVICEPDRVKPEAILAALEKAREPAVHLR
jgi:hypothetical protein